MPDEGRQPRAAEPDLDRGEWKRLRDEINRGVPNTGIYKVDGEGLERENRSPIFKGAVVGFGLGANAALAYVGVYSIFDPSPGYISSNDNVVMLLIWTGVTVIGATFGWLYDKYVPTRRKPPKSTL